MFSDYINIHHDGWNVLILRDFAQDILCPLICRDSLESAAGLEKVHSSDTADVYRFGVEANGRRVTLYIKDYLSRSWLDQIKHIFRPSRAKRAFMAGVMLEDNGLKCPRTIALFEKHSALNRRNILVTEAMPDGLSLVEFVNRLRDCPDIKGFSSAFANTVGRMHAKGIFHGDLRGGNLFIASNDHGWDFYFIDNEGTRKSKYLSFRRRLKNLVQLNMLPLGIRRTERMRFFKLYAQAAGLDRLAARHLRQKINQKTSVRLKNRARKHLGMPEAGPEDHKRFQRVRIDGCEGIFAQSFCDVAAAKPFLQKIDTLLANGQVLKDDVAARVVRCTYQNHDIVIKRYNYRGPWHALRHNIKGSRAQKCWRFGHYLASANIPCAAPLAFIHEKKYGLVRRSYIINEYIDGPLLYDIMNRPEYTPPQRQAVLDKAKQILTALYHERLTHDDMKPANMIIRNDQPVLIDLDSMHRPAVPFYFRYRYRRMVRYFYARMHGKKKA